MKNILTVLLALGSLTVCAQNYQTELERRYELALLDSAIRYEQLKPVAFNLLKAQSNHLKEISALRMQLSIQELETKSKTDRLQMEAITQQRRSRRIIGLLGLVILAQIII